MSCIWCSSCDFTRPRNSSTSFAFYFTMPKRKSNDGTPKRDAHLVHLETFRRSLPHVSGSALSSILQEIEEQGLPQLKQRKHFQQARDHLLSKYTAYGPLLTSISLECANGSAIQIPCANFCHCVMLATGMKAAWLVYSMTLPINTIHQQLLLGIWLHTMMKLWLVIHWGVTQQGRCSWCIFHLQKWAPFSSQKKRSGYVALPQDLLWLLMFVEAWVK